MHSLTPGYLSALRFDGNQAATLRALGKYQGKQQLYATQSPEALKDLRQVAVVESTESSNRLEGVVVAPSRLKSLVIRNATPKSRSEQEIAGYRDALALIHESAMHMVFSEGLVLQLHAQLYRYMPQTGGHWKATNNDIIERHPYTLEVRLTYELTDPLTGELDPSAYLRHYRDARMSEVTHCYVGRRWQDALGLEASARTVLGHRLRMNVFLSKWLQYLAEQGHSRFTLEPRQEPERLRGRIASACVDA